MFVFGCAKTLRVSCDTEPTRSFGSPIFKTHPLGNNFFIDFNPFGCVSAAKNFASILYTLFPADVDNLLQWPFPKHNHFSSGNQSDPLDTWIKTIQDPALKRPTKSFEDGVSTMKINNFIPHSVLLDKTESFLVEGTSFLEKRLFDVLRPLTQTSLLFRHP